MVHVDASNEEEMKIWEEKNRKIAQMVKGTNVGEGRGAVALVCQNFSCSPPVTSADALESMLSRKKGIERGIR